MTTTNTRKMEITRIDLQFGRWLLALLIVAFVLRLWGIWNASSSDEYNEVFEALRVCSGNLNLERWGKRFYLYILAIEYGVFYIIGWVLNLFQSPDDFAVKIIRDPSPLFVLGRLTSAVLGTGSVWLTYLVGRQLYNRSAGLIAALFLCFNVVNIELSHYARVDACLVFMVMAAFYWIAKIASNDRQSLIWYAFAGILSGIAFQNKLPAVVLLCPFAFAYFSRFPLKEYLRALFTKAIFLFCLAYLLGLVIGNPAVLFAPMSFVKKLMGSGGAYTTPVNEAIFTIGYIVYIKYFIRELGIPLVFLALSSLLYVLITRQRKDLLLLSFILPFYGLMGASKYMVSSSYMIPLMPFLYLLMARTLHSGLNRIEGIFIKKRFFTTLTLVVLLIYPLVNVWKLELSFTGKNTRVLAKEWIEMSIPYDSKILMDSGKTINSFAPLIAGNEVSIQRTLNRKSQEIATGSLQDQTKMVDSGSLKYFQYLLQTVPKESYDLTSTQFGLVVQTVDFYIANDFQYFIISEELKRSRSSNWFASRKPDVARFYRSLDSDNRIELIKKIEPGPKNRGDSFLIYKVNQQLANT